MTEAEVLLDELGAVATVTLNRPKQHNALTPEVLAQLTDIFMRLGEREEIRCIVLKANGPSFCAGADLEWMRAAQHFTEAENYDDARRFSLALRTIDSCPKPVICLVQGPVLGGGVGLICVSDIVIATEAASIAFREVTLGLIPAVISPYVVQTMGARQARRFFLTAETISAQEAKGLGLFHQVVPDHQSLANEGDFRISDLLNTAPGAVAAAKALVAAVNRPLDEALCEDTARRIAKRRVTEEAKAGMEAFVQGRKPPWERHQ